MFYLDSQQKVASSPLRQELEGASVIGVAEGASAKPAATGTSKKKSKRKGK